MDVVRRRSGLISRSVSDEFVVYDPDRCETHALDRVASAVFQACDEPRRLDEIVGTVAAQRNSGVLDTAQVHVALEQLSAAGVIEYVGAPDRIKRRAALRAGAAAIGGAVALPMVQSIIAPTPAAAQSGGGGGGSTGNLVSNGSFEADEPNPGPAEPNDQITGWTSNACRAYRWDATVENGQVGSSGATFASIIAFSGAWLFQDVDVTAYATSIDANTATYAASGYLGSVSGPGVDVEMNLIFLDVYAVEISQAYIGSAPNATPAWFPVSGSGPVPPGTRNVRVLLGGHPQYSTAGGGADLISLSLNY